jgi:hypothetical protein
VTEVGHDFAAHFLCFYGLDDRGGHCCCFYGCQHVFEALSEGGWFGGVEGLVVLEEGEVEEVDDEMSEEDDVVLVVDIEGLLQTDFLEVGGGKRVRPLAPVAPIELYILCIFEEYFPFQVVG